MTWTEKLGISKYVDLKSLIFGSAISTTCVIFGMQGGQFEWAYPLVSIGFIYVGYKAINMKMSVVLGALAAIPIVILATDYDGFGPLNDTQTLVLTVASIFIVGIFISAVGYYLKREREKAKVEYEKKQQIGKNKKKNKNEK